MPSENSKRIAKNTLFLYFRMLITMAVSLYTSRVVLNTLGVEDYGIYNVVGGVVLMFSSINTTMATAVQRFMNFEMGRKDQKKLNLIFNTSIILHIGIAFIIFILIESIGVWFLNTKMNIAPERMGAANWVLQFSLFAFVVTILSVPYNAAIIANERMKAFAFISIFEVSLKLLIVFMLVWFSFDKLKLYAVLVFVVSVIIRIFYGIYSKRHFEECHFHWQWDKALFKEMTFFAGWNMIGVTSGLLRTQGVNIVLNLFFGTVINAAMGIANQVKQAIESFVNNFLTALNPQITKSYAAGERSYLMNLVFRGSRYGFYLLLFLTLPVLIETEFILRAWLKIVPEYAVIFVRLILILSIIESLSKTLIQTMFATGEIRNYQLIVGGITLLNLPLSILFLYLEYPPPVIFIVAIGIAIIALFVRLIMLSSMVGFSIKKYFINVIINVFKVGGLSLLLPFLLFLFTAPGFTRFLLVSFMSAVSVAFVIYLVGLSSKEKLFVKEKIKEIKILVISMK